jgi:hypothetical protein
LTQKRHKKLKSQPLFDGWKRPVSPGFAAFMRHSRTGREARTLMTTSKRHSAHHEYRRL